MHRRVLPQRRQGYTHEAIVGGQKIFLGTGEYADGTLGEIFINVNKKEALLSSMLNCFCVAVSLGLQYGVPLEKFVDQFTFTKFDPAGPVQNHSRIKLATSLMDFVFRDLALHYLGRDDLGHVKPEE